VQQRILPAPIADQPVASSHGPSAPWCSARN